MDNDAISHAIRDLRIAEYWYAPGDDDAVEELVYRPSIFIECLINFRSLKAGLNPSEERQYAAWFGAYDLPVDWDSKAIDPIDAARIGGLPNDGIESAEPAPEISEVRFESLETDLVDDLVRRERFELYHNPLFDVFSNGEEPLSDFLDRTAEIALQQIEPELKQLKHVFELQLEQVREAHITRRGSEAAESLNEGAQQSQADVERILTSRTEFFEVGTRITSLFTGLAGFVLQMPFSRSESTIETGDALELREDLRRVEREAADALNEVYTRYLEMVRTYDEFAVRIQPNNIRILRRGVLWVPTKKAANPSEVE